MKNMKKIGTLVVLILAWAWTALFVFGFISHLLEGLCNRNGIAFDGTFYSLIIIVTVNLTLTYIATKHKGMHILLLALVFLVPFIFQWLYLSKLPVGRHVDTLVHVGEQVNKVKPRYPYCPYFYEGYYE